MTHKQFHHQSNHHSRRATAVMLLAAMLAAAVPLRASTVYWDRNGAASGAGTTTLNGNWDITSANWTTSAAGTDTPSARTTSSTDDLYFVANPGSLSGNNAYTVTVLGTQSAHSLNFQASGPTTISGGTAICLYDGGINIPQYAYPSTNNRAVSIGTPLSLQAAQTWTVNSAAGYGLTISSTITNGANTLTIDGTGNTTISGVLGGGSGSVIKNGSGILTFSNTNTYTGTTFINAGTLVTDTAGINATDTLAFGGGRLKSGASGIVTGKPISATGTISLDTTNAAITLNGNIAATTSGLTLAAGSNPLTLSGINRYTGVTTISNGTLLVADTDGINGTDTTSAILFNGGTLTARTAAGISTGKPISASSTILLDTRNGPISLSGNIAATAAGLNFSAGSNPLTLAGINNYTGATSLAGGTLIARNALALGTLSAPLSLGGGTLDLQVDSSIAAYNTTLTADSTIASDTAAPNSAGITHTLGTLAISGQKLSLARGTNVTSGTAGLAFDTTTLSSANSTVFETAAGTNLTLGALTGEFSFQKTGNGQLTLNTSSNRTQIFGSTTLYSGTLRLGAADALNTSTAGTLAVDGGTLSLGVTAGTTYHGTTTTLYFDATVESDVDRAGSSGVTQTLGTLTMAGQTLTIRAGGNVSGGAPAVAFGETTVAGDATFNTTTAALVLDALSIGAFTLNTTGTGIKGTSVANATTLTGKATFNPTTAAIALNTVTGAGTQNLVLDGTSSGNAIIGAINTSGGSVTKSNTSTWTLSGVSSYTGATTISAGTLVVGDDAISTTVAGAIATVSKTNSTFTYSANPLASGNRVIFAGTTPGGITAGNVYYVINATGPVFQVSSTSGGSPILLTGSVTSVTVSRAGALGSTNSPVVLGDVNSSTNSASLLVGGAFTMARPVTVANFGSGATLGGNSAACSSFTGTITLNKAVTLTAAKDGTVDFNSSWVTNNNPITITAAGVVKLSKDLSDPAGVTVNSGQLQLSATLSGPLSLNSATLAGSGSVNGATTITGGTINGSGLKLLDIANFNGAGNAITGGTLSVTGLTSINQGGTLTLARGATLNGGGSISDSGTLNVDGTIAKDVTVNSGGLLTGSGSISGLLTVNSGGHLSPGNSPGLFTTGSLTLANGSTLDMQLGGTIRGSLYDAVDITGALSVAGGANLVVTTVNGYTYLPGDTFQLFNFGSGSAHFDSLSLPTLNSSLVWNTDHLSADGYIGVVSAVPETSSMLMGLLIAGGLGLPYLRRKLRSLRKT